MPGTGVRFAGFRIYWREDIEEESKEPLNRGRYVLLVIGWCLVLRCGSSVSFGMLESWFKVVVAHTLIVMVVVWRIC